MLDTMLYPQIRRRFSYKSLMLNAVIISLLSVFEVWELSVILVLCSTLIRFLFVEMQEELPPLSAPLIS